MNPAGIEHREEKELETYTDEELVRIRCLVSQNSLGSATYQLDLSRKDLGCTGIGTVKALAKVLQEGNHDADLQSLELSCNSFTCDHIEVLGQALQKCKNLRTLFLSGNMIEDRGCYSLSQYLPNATLYLYLDHNLIGEEGSFLIHGAADRRPELLVSLDENPDANVDVVHLLNQRFVDY